MRAERVQPAADRGTTPVPPTPTMSIAAQIDASTLRTVAIYVVCLVLSVAVHEFAHAWAAHRLGDDTPEREGRLTLNPVAHADPIGTLLLPLIAGLTNTPLFGWGRPVPTNPVRYTRKVSMRVGLALVSVAGPLANLALAAVVLLAAAGASLAGVLNPQTAALLHGLMTLNIFLMVFNLLPVHPLDGGKILAALLPEKWRAVDDFLLQWGGTILIVLVLVGGGLIATLAAPLFHVSNLLWSAVVR